MEILPIKSIREEDSPVVGQNIVSLAKLAQSGLPVADGVVVFPPEIKLKTILERFKYPGKEVFEQSLHIVKREVTKIPPPDDLMHALSGKKIDTRQLWLGLLDVWLEQIRSKIWREGFSPDLVSILLAQPVFFVKKIQTRGHAFYDYHKDGISITLIEGVLDDNQKIEVEELVKKADKKLFIQHIYHFIDGGGIKLVKVSPFTQYPSTLTTHHDQKPLKNERTKPAKTAVKVFFDPVDTLRFSQVADGIFISSENLWDRDTKILQLVEAATSKIENPVIYKFPGESKVYRNIKGAVALIHDQKLFAENSQIFLFARNKKMLSNIQIGLPFTRSVLEFATLKRELAASGITRKSSLKMYLEMAIPENFINLEKYIEIGVDGVVISLDDLSYWIEGFGNVIENDYIASSYVENLIKFLNDGVKILRKNRVAVIIKGRAASHDEMLEFIVKNGISGAIANTINLENFCEHLGFIEKRVFTGHM